MDIELNILFSGFQIINCSNSNLDTIIDIVKNCQLNINQIVHLQRNDTCIQYFRIVEKVYGVKNIKIIVINGENVYYYPSIIDMNETLYFKYIANDLRERIDKMNEVI